jgi:hypothetical protein
MPYLPASSCVVRVKVSAANCLASSSGGLPAKGMPSHSKAFYGVFSNRHSRADQRSLLVLDSKRDPRHNQLVMLFGQSLEVAMGKKWDQAAIQKYIDNEVQESLTLEYKAADALGKSDGKKKEVTKDVSAMANSAGGIIVYGVREFQDPSKKHLPEYIDPIEQTQFSREWLEQVVNNIQPHINGVVIYPVSIGTTPNHVVYVVEIPHSTTAHQATDLRYYKRFNFQSIPMEDYEIRDVMNRATVSDAHVEFGLYSVGDPHSLFSDYALRVIVENQGIQVINRFKIIMVLTNTGWWHDDSADEIRVEGLKELEVDDNENVEYTFRIDENGSHNIEIVYQSTQVLFPKERVDIGWIKWAFTSFEDVDPTSSFGQWRKFAKQRKWSLKWTLYADNMPRKQGIIPIYELPKA